MSEPITPSVAALGAGSIIIAGVATGLEYDILAPALVGALLGLKNLEPGTWWVRGLQSGGAALVAAWSTPISVALVGKLLLDGDASAARFPVAVVLGYMGPTLLPLTRDALTRWFGSRGN